jgi:hypothetical protein
MYDFVNDAGNFLNMKDFFVDTRDVSSYGRLVEI